MAGILGGAAPYSYTAFKHAIVALTKKGAAELGMGSDLSIYPFNEIGSSRF